MLLRILIVGANQTLEGFTYLGFGGNLEILKLFYKVQSKPYRQYGIPLP